jgi:hypothetical protein
LLFRKRLTVPEKPYSEPGNYDRIAQRLAAEKGWFWANQFANTANRRGALHYDRPGKSLGLDFPSLIYGKSPFSVSEATDPLYGSWPGF